MLDQVVIFNIWRSCRTVFHNGCALIYILNSSVQGWSPYHCTRVSLEGLSTWLLNGVWVDIFIDWDYGNYSSQWGKILSCTWEPMEEHVCVNLSSCIYGVLWLLLMLMILNGVLLFRGNVYSCLPLIVIVEVIFKEPRVPANSVAYCSKLL